MEGDKPFFKGSEYDNFCFFLVENGGAFGKIHLLEGITGLCEGEKSEYHQYHGQWEFGMAQDSGVM